MEQRYTALRTIGSVYKVLGIIAGAVTLLTVLGIGSFLGGFLGGGFLGILVMLIFGGGIALTLYATGEGMFLLLALEENTRVTATALQRQLDILARAQPAIQSGAVAQSGPVLSTNPVGRGGQIQPRE
jgi:hypothetical protein